MLMKVFNKGQVVIPVAIRKEFGIEIGDMLDVVADTKEKCVKLKRAGEMKLATDPHRQTQTKTKNMNGAHIVYL